MTYSQSPEHDFIYLEDALFRQSPDFSSTYMTLKSLVVSIETYPQCVSVRTIDAIVCIIESGQHGSQKMSFFLFREAAEALVKISVYCNTTFKIHVMSILLELLNSSKGNKHRAIAESIGSLPVSITPPVVSFCAPKSPLPEIHWSLLAEKTGIMNHCKCHWYGRSVAIKRDSDNIAVFKFLKRDEDLYSLQSESNWLEFLCGGNIEFKKRFEIPRPVEIDESFLFTIKHFPFEIPGDAKLAPCRTAICFTITHEYFSYPNDTVNILNKDDLGEVLSRNAYLLGKLTSQGIIHTAPIPLFHNRIQKSRRSDEGIYIWSKGGRLDQWLESCLYPNFGKSGLRDFEHLEIYQESDKKLYHQIGSHMLSLILVAGSYFRISGEKKQKTTDKPNTLPKDTRHLYDKLFFSFLIQIIFKGYYKGFTGQDRCEKIQINTFELAGRLIEEMGIDNHMDEVLRTADQKSMSDEEFKGFLIKRGFDLQLISEYNKGENNIKISTGPHLGGFNRKISVPELIHYLETISAYCIAGRLLSKRTVSEC